MSLQMLHSRAVERSVAQESAAQKIKDFVLAHPGCTHGQAATAAGVPITKVSRLCGPQLAQQLEHSGDEWTGVSDLTMLTDVNAVVHRLGSVPSSALYAKSRLANQVSLSQLISRFGSWALALETAGFAATAASTQRSREELLQILAQFAKTGATSQGDYTRWAADRAVPSAGWMVVKLGPWRPLIAQLDGVR